MRKIDFWPQATAFLDSLPGKHQRQIAEKISVLIDDPFMPSSKQLEGFGSLRRLRSGDYRIVYFATESLLTVVLVGKRNDDAIYRQLLRMFQ